MKPLLAALVFAVFASPAAAAPATLKEVFAQEAEWRIAPPAKDLLASDRGSRSREAASSLLARIANGRSDSERKTASYIAQANRAALDPVLAAAEPLDAARVKALRAALDRIAAAKSAAPADQAEVARVLAALR